MQSLLPEGQVNRNVLVLVNWPNLQITEKDDKKDKGYEVASPLLFL